MLGRLVQRVSERPQQDRWSAATPSPWHDEAAAREPSVVARGMRHWLVPAVGPALVLLAWSAVSRSESVISRFLASPWEVAQALWSLAVTGELLDHTVASIFRVLVGLGVAVAVGVPTGLLMGWWPTAERALAPLLEFLRPIPIAAWVPLSVLVFGIGELPARVLIFLGAVHPIIVNTVLGVRSVERLHIRAAQMLGARQRDIVWRVLIPSALPSVITGIRLGLGIAWWVVIVAELLAVRSGLGYVMVSAQALLRSDIIIAGILVIGLVGYALNRLALWIESRVTPWRRYA